MRSSKLDKLKNLKSKARKYSIAQGIFASAKINTGDNYVQPFAIAINSKNYIVALLPAISGLLGPLSQIYGSKAMKKYSRKRIILTCYPLRLIFWVSLILLSILFYKNKLVPVLPAILLGLYAVYNILAGISYPAWFSWVGELVSKEYRGRWFSKRNLLMGIFGTGVLIASAAFLDIFKKRGSPTIGFAILFGFAFIFGLISLHYMRKQYEPKLKISKKDQLTFNEFLKKATKTNFGKFTLFRSMILFSSTISSSLLAVYLLRELQLSYLLYVIIVFGAGIVSFLSLEIWGKFADKYGNYAVIALTTIIIPLVPILWILLPSPIYLFFVPSLLNHLSWAGFNLSASNFIYDNVSQKKVGPAISYHNILAGSGVFLGSIVAAILIKFLPSLKLEPIQLIFIISSLACMLTVAYWIPKLREVRKTSKFEGAKSIKEMIEKEGEATLKEEFHQLMALGRYLHPR